MIDDYALQRELDRTKSRVFIKKNSAFLGSVMSSLEFKWDSSISTAATDGVSLFWNKDFFLSLPPDARETVLRHEIDHVAKLHMLRGENLDKEVFNQACDYRINNDLAVDGFSFVGLEGALLDHSFDTDARLSEEEIYDILIKRPRLPTKDAWNGEDGDGDMKPASKDIQQKALQNVVRAVHQAKVAGNVPGGVEDMVSSFLAPSIPWESLLFRWFTDQQDEDYTWQRPNRRSPDIYLPSKIIEEGKLDHLMYFQDVSGSISNENMRRFNSELSHVWNSMEPKKMTVVQFDTDIQKATVFEEGDTFDKMEIVGRGGTCLVCVRDYIIEHKPTAVVIFSDLECPPMDMAGINVPVIWVVLGNPDATVERGDVVHIKG
jgi:predicted metal-dependent peptidase